MKNNSPMSDRRSKEDRRLLRPRLGIHDASHGPGGPTRYVESILDRIDPDEFDVTIFCPADGVYVQRSDLSVCVVAPGKNDGRSAAVDAEPFVPKARRWRDHWRRFAPSRLRLWTGLTRDCLKLRGDLRRHSLDLFHANICGCEEHAASAWLAGVPAILGTLHVDSTYDLKHECQGIDYQIAHRLAGRCLDRAIAVSQATGEDWVRCGYIASDRVVAIPNGIDSAFFAPRCDKMEARRRWNFSDDEILIGGVGRLHEAKGFEFLIDAVARVLPEFPQVRLVLAGEGPLREALVRQVESLGIGARVSFVGFQSDVRPFLEMLDVFVLSSRCEALPFALLEAMAMRLPVVATRTGGVAEVIQHGRSGLLAPSGDAAAIADRLRPLLRSPAMRRRMGCDSRERVVHDFSLEQSVARTIAVYRELIRVLPKQRVMTNERQEVAACS